MPGSLHIAGLGVPIGLNFSEIMMIGQAREIETAFLAEMLLRADAGFRAARAKMPKETQNGE